MAGCQVGSAKASLPTYRTFPHQRHYSVAGYEIPGGDETALEGEVAFGEEATRDKREGASLGLWL